MKFLTLLAVALFAFVPFVAMADTAIVSENGGITMTGEVDNVGSDEFTMIVNGNDVEVSMDQLNEDTLEYLIDTGVVQSGAYVTVYGDIEDDIGSRKVIKARTIQLYSRDNF